MTMSGDGEVRLSAILAPEFRELHKTLNSSYTAEVWCRGGRGSTKSSFLAIQVLLGLTKDPEAHAFISRRYDNELRDSVFGQVMWAANKLGIAHLWRFMTSPMQAVNLMTGQKVLFRGVDNPLKVDGLKPKPAKSEPSLDDIMSW